jgi:hypothetical protein
MCIGGWEWVGVCVCMCVVVYGCVWLCVVVGVWESVGGCEVGV